MKRYENWPELLDDFLRERRESAFKWGENDCALFVADAVQIMTGFDIAAGLRGAYKTEGDLIALFGDDVMKRFETIFENHLADYVDPIEVSRAQRGDIVMWKGEIFSSLGICYGYHSFFTGPAGVVAMPTLDSVRAWKV